MIRLAEKVKSIACRLRRMAKAGCGPEQILFIGDDEENDFAAPRRMGMQAILLDKKAGALKERVNDFYGISQILLDSKDV